MTDKQLQAARINGAKSHGPVTAEGKARSARNAIKHGLKSDMIVLEHEDRQAFEQLRESYMDDFHPANQSQADLVETMVAARWRMNRVFMIEGQLLEKEMALHRKEVEKRFSVIEARRPPSLRLRDPKPRQDVVAISPLRSPDQPHLRTRFQTVTATTEPRARASGRRNTKRTQAHPNPARSASIGVNQRRTKRTRATLSSRIYARSSPRNSRRRSPIAQHPPLPSPSNPARHRTTPSTLSKGVYCQPSAGDTHGIEK